MKITLLNCDGIVNSEIMESPKVLPTSGAIDAKLAAQLVKTSTR